MARSSGEKTAAPIVVGMFNKEGQNTGARALTNRCSRDTAKAAAARPKDNSKNVRTPDNKAALVAADEYPRENGVRNEIATREKSDPNSEQQCRVGHGNWKSSQSRVDGVNVELSSGLKDAYAQDVSKHTLEPLYNSMLVSPEQDKHSIHDG